MYSKLKDVMRSKGYEVSEGGEWAASDTPHFEAFAKFVLGAHAVSPNQVMAYPQAFPALMEALQDLREIGEEVVDFVEGVLTPEDTEPAAAPIDPPVAEAAPIDPPAAAPLDVSGEGAAPAQEPAADAPVETSDAPVESTETPADEAHQE